MTYFFADESISIRLVRMLVIFDRKNRIRGLQHSFPRGTPDTRWIREIAAWNPKPVIICGDGRITRNPVERAVLREAGLTFICFSIGWMNLSWEVQAWKLIKVWPDVLRAVSKIKEPTLFKVTVSSLKVQEVQPIAQIQ